MKQINRVLLLLPAFAAGGAERVLVILANSLANRGIKTTILVFDKDSSFFEVDEKVQLIRLNNPEIKKGGLKKYYKIPGIVRNVRGIINEIKPEVVISFSYITNVIAVIAGEGRNTKVILSERTDPVRYNTLQRTLMRLLYRKASGFVFQTNSIQRKYSNEYKVGNSVVIYNPISQEQIGEKKEKERLILSVGRLIPEKNHELLIRAFASSEKLKGYELKIYGDGPRKDYLIDLIRRLKMDKRIKLCGVESNPIKQHNGARAFVLASYVEGFPNVLIEAMANGMICVASDIESGVIREIISDGENGYLFKNRDVYDLQNKLEMAVVESERNDKLSENARRIYDSLKADIIMDKWMYYIYSV